MKWLLMPVICVILVQPPTSAGFRFGNADEYTTFECRLCGTQADVPPAFAAPVILNRPRGNGWINTFIGVLIGGTLTFLFQRQLKVWELRFALLREAMAFGQKCDRAALKYLSASINLTRIEKKFPRDPKMDPIESLTAPGGMKAAEQRRIMDEARDELGAVLFEAINLLVPMPVLFSRKVQQRYSMALDCYSSERHRYVPTKMRESVREFHSQWISFNKIAARSCGMRYRRAAVPSLILSKEDQELLLRVLRSADELGAKEG